MSEDLLNWAIQEKAQIKAQMTVLKEEDDKINRILMQALDSEGSKSAKSVFGTVTLKEVTRETIDKKKLPEELVKRGIPAETIAQAIKAATKVSQSRYIEFRSAA